MNYKIQFFALLVVCFFGQAQNVKLKTGDLVFQKMTCGPLCDAIHAVTAGYQGNDFSHLGLVVLENNTVYIIEAAGEAVRKVRFEEFAKNTESPMFVGRVKTKYKKLIPKVVSFCNQQLGVAYDDVYRYNNGKYYCSELVYDAFLAAFGKPFFELEPMTFKSPNSNTFFEVWVDYYESLKAEVPEGEPGCNPGGISKSKRVSIVGTLH